MLKKGLVMMVILGMGAQAHALVIQNNSPEDLRFRTNGTSCLDSPSSFSVGSGDAITIQQDRNCQNSKIGANWSVKNGDGREVGSVGFQNSVRSRSSNGSLSSRLSTGLRATFGKTNFPTIVISKRSGGMSIMGWCDWAGC